MNLMEFRKKLKIRLNILRINCFEKLLFDSTHLIEEFIGFLFSMSFTIVTIIFMTTLFRNVKEIAGYSINDIFVFQLIGQFNFFIINSWSSENMQDMMTSVRSGAFDLILSKPVPSLFYTTFRKIDLLYLLTRMLPALIPYFLLINWSTLNIQASSALAAIIILISGQISLHVFQFMSCVSIFWFGRADDLYSLSWAFEYDLGRNIPYEGITNDFRIIFITIIPVLIPTALTTSVLLQKSDALIGIIIAACSAIFSLVLKNWVWKKALKAYTSASS